MPFIFNTNEYNKGKLTEEKVKPLIMEYWKNKYNIKQSKNTFEKFDFFDTINKTVFELKGRFNSKLKYSTTMINIDKVNNNNKTIFLFNFIDELCYIEYNEELFNKFEKKNFCRGRAGDTDKLMFYIPITELITIHKY